MEEFTIDIAKEFSPLLGGRSKKVGPYSGEEFYDSILKDKFDQAINSDKPLHVYLDGTSGYGSSFLDQSFGELYRNYGPIVMEKIIFHTSLFDWIVSYIKSDIWVKK